MDAATGSLAISICVSAGSTNSMYSRVSCGVYGQRTLTRIDTIGSLTTEAPVIAMTPSATISDARPTVGIPLAFGPPMSETQASEIASFGASA